MAAGTLPTITVDIAFVNNPFDASYTWTTLPPGTVRNISIKRGRQHERSKFDVGTCDLELDNADRRYDPTNSSSPYSPNVDVLKPLRIRATWAGITYDLFSGFVQSYQPNTTLLAASATTLHSVDAFALLNLYNVANAKYAAAVLADGATTHYRLGDPAGATTIIDSTTNRYDAGVAALSLGQTGLLVTDIDGAANFDGTASAVYVPQAAAITSGADWTYECWFKCGPQNLPTPFSGAGMAVLWEQGDTLMVGIMSTIDGVNPGRVGFAFRTGVGAYTLSIPFGAARVDNNLPHHLVFSSVAGAVTCILDGVNVGGITPAYSGIGNLDPGSIGAPLVSGNFDIGRGFFNGTIDEVALYRGVGLTVAKAQNHYTLGAGAFAQALSGTHLNATLDAIGFPSALRSIAAGRSFIQAATGPLSTQTALAYMQAVEATEAGQLFMSAAGWVTFLDRYVSQFAPYNAALAIFGDSVAELATEGATQIPLDDSDVFTEVLAQRNGGQVQRAFTAAPVTRYGPRTRSLAGLLNINDLEALDRANFELGLYTTSSPRLPSVTIRPLNDPANLFPQVLGRELCDRVGVVRRPPGGGPAFTQDSFIEQITHDITTDGEWTTGWATVPVANGGRQTNYLTFDDTTLGKVDSNTFGY